MPARKKGNTSQQPREEPTKAKRGRPPTKLGKNTEKAIEEIDIGDFQYGDTSPRRSGKGRVASCR